MSFAKMISLIWSVSSCLHKPLTNQVTVICHMFEKIHAVNVHIRNNMADLKMLGENLCKLMGNLQIKVTYYTLT